MSDDTGFSASKDEIWPRNMYASPREVDAEPPKRASKPVKPYRIWTAILVSGLSIVMATVVAGVVLAIAALMDAGPVVMTSPTALNNWLAKFAQTRIGLLVLVLPGQFVFLGMAVGAALLSPQQTSRRLAIHTGWMPVWTWILFIAATPMVGLISSLILSQLVSGPSPQLQMMEDMMIHHSKTFFPGLVLLVAVLPGFVEELLFRGYLQSRLLVRWPPLVAVCFAAMAFAAVHLDPIHIIGVLPLGLWLGLVAWRAGCIWPAILCHIANNFVAILGSRMQGSSGIEVAWDSLTISMLLVGGPAFLLSLLIFVLFRD